MAAPEEKEDEEEAEEEEEEELEEEEACKEEEACEEEKRSPMRANFRAVMAEKRRTMASRAAGATTQSASRSPPTNFWLERRRK